MGLKEMVEEKERVYNEFKVKCPHCRTITLKEKGKVWTICPKCNTALDIMNKVGKVN